MPNIIIIIVIAAILIIFIFSGFKVIRPTERALVETLGKYTKFALAGLHWVFPLIQKIYKVNITEIMADIEPQEIITKNRMNAKVDLVIYYKVRPDEESIKKSLYNVNDYHSEIVMLAKTTARNVIGELIFEDVNSKRNELNKKLQQTLDHESNAWGVEVVRVELKEILPPADVQETMNNVIKGENKKTAALDFASAKEIEADGERRSHIQVAEGKKRAAILEAEGKAHAFELINKSFVGNAQLLKQLDVTQNSLSKNSKIILTENGISPQLIIGNIPVNEINNIERGTRENIPEIIPKVEKIDKSDN